VIVIDLNVLVAAFRSDHPHHSAASPWLSTALAAPGTVIVPDLVWVGFVRIVTNSRIVVDPAPLEVASQFVLAVTESAGYRSVPGHLDGLQAFLDECAQGEASGDLVPDAYVASIARSYGCPVASFDRDLRRFDDLRLVTPAVDQSV